MDVHKKFKYIEGDYTASIFKMNNLIGYIEYASGCFHPFLYFMTKEQYELYLNGKFKPKTRKICLNVCVF